MGHKSRVRQQRKAAQDRVLPSPWAGPDYELVGFTGWVKSMHLAYGRGVVTYYFGKLPTCYLLRSHPDIGPVEALMIDSYDPETEYVGAVPAISSAIATPQMLVNAAFVTRVARLEVPEFQLLVPKSNHTHPGLVFA